MMNGAPWSGAPESEPKYAHTGRLGGAGSSPMSEKTKRTSRASEQAAASASAR